MEPRRQDEMDESPREECGVFGIFAPGVEVAKVTFFGLFALQHRGQESAGIAVSDGFEIHHFKDVGLVTQIFDEESFAELNGYIAIGHTRYSTTGLPIARNSQPICCASVAGDIAVGHNGNLVNTMELRDALIADGIEFQTTNDTEVIAKMIALKAGDGLEDAVANVMKQLKGAYSLAIMSPVCLIAARDPFGLRPLCVGQLPDGHYVIASETCALNVVGATYVRDVEPGEMVIIDESGMREVQVMPLERHATCLFEFIYFARPDSRMYGTTLHSARRRMGHELAEQHPCPEGQIVIPIPDSAVAAALGYAEASGIPYAEGVIKNRYIHRTFIQPDERMRELGAKMKYSPLHDVLAGKRVVMVDDSIVRGTTTGKLVKMLLEAGAVEVHVRISAPPVKYPCFYGIDMADQDQLIAANMSEEEIRQWIGATSLGYLSLDRVIHAVGKKKDKFCRACFDKRYPIPIPEHLKVSKLMLEKNRDRRRKA